MFDANLGALLVLALPRPLDATLDVRLVRSAPFVDLGLPMFASDLSVGLSWSFRRGYSVGVFTHYRERAPTSSAGYLDLFGNFDRSSLSFGVSFAPLEERSAGDVPIDRCDLERSTGELRCR
jgi:hypothetical protein